MSGVQADQVLDVRGLSCPMPLVRARQAAMGLHPGQVLEVISTDRGSVRDFQGWAAAAKDIELLRQEVRQAEGKDLYVHYVQRRA